MDNKLIEALKKNEKPFGLMTEEMQREIKGMNPECLQALSEASEDFSVGWTNSPSLSWLPLATYRLRPDYKEEPEIVEWEVKTLSECFLYAVRGDKTIRLDICHIYPDFIGFWYRGLSIMSSSDRLYMITGEEVFTPHVMLQDDNDIFDVDSYEVLTPTHVLFKRSK